VYCPIGTILFEASILLEDPSDVGLVLVDFMSGDTDGGRTGGSSREFEPYSINGMGNNDQYSPPFTSQVSVNISLDMELNHNDSEVLYQFTLSILVTGGTINSTEVGVCLHEIGKSNG